MNKCSSLDSCSICQDGGVSTQTDEPGRNARRKAATRAKLLAAARRRFAAQGVEPTTIRDIAAAADVALGSFYNYFRTKEDVLGALLEEALGQQLRLLVSRQDQVEDVAEQVSIAHRHLLAAVRADPDWGWLLLRLEVDYGVVESALGPRAGGDLDRGLETGRFAVSDPRVALRASGGALLGIVGGVLRGEFTAEDDCAHAEGVLRSFGIAPDEAAEVSRRPLPPLRGDAG
jgi:AcrR family transcriptional regulator